MATNNNDARKKQKRMATIAELEIELTIKEGECQRLRSRNKALKSEATSTTTILPITPAVVEEFSDFLFCLLPYIADRVIWNAIASSNKDMHKKSKTILPPWPLYYKVPSDDFYSIMTWSPCGTHIACLVNYANIVIFDQRFGPLGHNGRINAHTHDRSLITNLKYSPNGRFLVSSGSDGYGFVRVWDTVTGNYEQLQEWNMREEVVNDLRNNAVVDICFSSCSKYIAVSLATCVLLKNFEGKTINSFMFPTDNRLYIDNIMFSSNDRAIFICCREQIMGIDLSKAIKLWRPYLGIDDEDRMITIWKQEANSTWTPRANSDPLLQTITFSNDKTMVAIHNKSLHKGTVWSIDTNHEFLTKKFDFEGSTGLYFTPDRNYIICNKENGSTLWSIPEGKFTNDTIHFMDKGNNTNLNPDCIIFSPNNEQVILDVSKDRYITSYSVQQHTTT